MIKLTIKLSDSEIKASGHSFHLACYNLQTKLIKNNKSEILDSGAVYEAFNELTENDESSIEFEDAPENNFTITKVIKEEVIENAPEPAPAQEAVNQSVTPAIQAA